MFTVIARKSSFRKMENVWRYLQYLGNNKKDFYPLKEEQRVRKTKLNKRLEE